MSYTSVFGGTTIYPSDVSYLPLALSVDTTLEWPLEASGDVTVAARIIGVTPASAGRSVIMPDATRTGPGQSVLFNNMSGTYSFLVKDDGGTTLATVTPGTQWQIYLTDNTTAAGTWEVYQMGASTATVQASALAGPGLTVVGAQLAQAADFSEFTTDLSPSPANRATTYVYTGSGAATVTLPTAPQVDSTYFIRIRNQGDGVLLITPAGTDLVNGAPSLNLAPEDSAMFIFDGASEWYTVGLGQNAEFTFDYVSIGVAPGGTYVLSSNPSNLNRIAYRFTGTLTSNAVIVVPETVQQYWVNNQTSGPFTLGLKTPSQANPTLVNQNASAIMYSDGTEVVLADTSSIAIPVTVNQGGTGSTTASGARANLGISPYADPLVTAANSPAAQAVLFPAPITDGQMLIGNAATPGFAQTTLTAGTGISILNGPGSATIVNTGSPAPGSVYSQRFSGTGAQLAFTLAYQPYTEENTQVYINGVYQQKDTYSLSGFVITFTTAPPLGTDNIEVVVIQVVPIGATTASMVTLAPVGYTTATTVQQGFNDLGSASGSAHVGFLQSGVGAVSRTAQDKNRETLSVLDFGAVGDGVILSDAVMTAGSPILTSASGPFSPADVGKPIFVNGAGLNTYGLWTTIASYTSPNQVTLAASAVASVNAATEDARCTYGTDNYAAFTAAIAEAELLAADADFGGTCKVVVAPGKYIFSTLATGNVRGLRIGKNVCIENRGHMIMQAGNFIGEFLHFGPKVGETSYGGAEFFGGIVDSNFQTNDNTAAFGNGNAGGTAPVGTGGLYCSIHDTWLCNARTGGSTVPDPRVISGIPAGGKGITIQYGAYGVSVQNVKIINCSIGVTVEGKNTTDAAVNKIYIQAQIFNARYGGLRTANNAPSTPADLGNMNADLDLEIYESANGLDAYGNNVSDNFGVLTGQGSTGLSGKIRVINTTGSTSLFRGSWWQCNLEVVADITNAAGLFNFDKNGGRGAVDTSSQKNIFDVSVRINGTTSGYILGSSSSAFTLKQSTVNVNYSVYNGGSWSGTSWASAGGAGLVNNVFFADGNAGSIANGAIGKTEYTFDQVMFRVYNSTSSNNVTGDGTAVTAIPFDTAVYDVNAGFSGNQFTAPVAGIYNFSWGINLGNVDPADHTRVLMTLNATGASYGLHEAAPAFETFTGVKRFGRSGEVAVKMAAGDTAKLGVLVNGTSKTVDITGGNVATWFTGELISTVST